PRGIACAPVRHGAFRVVRQGLLEALDRLTMVEPEQPIEPPVEPKLGFGRRRGDFSAVGSKIEISHAFLPIMLCLLVRLAWLREFPTFGSPPGRAGSAQA